MTPTATATTESAARPQRLFGPEFRPFAIGAIALVTLGAFENRAVTTVLPTLAKEFSAIGSLGVVNAAPIASFVASLAFAGLWADRRGPVGPLRAGVLLFAVAQIIIGTAGDVSLVVAGRLLSGVAEGLLDVGLMVLIARVLPEQLRAKMFSLFAAAWIVPSVAGPFVSGSITEWVGWRWVFLGALAVLVPTWLMLQPALRIQGRQQQDVAADGPAAQDARSIMPWALIAATGVFGLTMAGRELEEHTAPAALAIVASMVATGYGAKGLLPAGVFRLGRGMPTVVAMRAFTSVAFAGTGAWLPLLLTLEHEFRASAAGISLTITGVMWAFGSWLQSRDHDFSRALILRVGLTLMAVGLTITSLLAWSSLSPFVGLAGWAVAAAGMGLASPTISLLVLSGSDTTNQGRNTSAMHMSGSLGFASSLAISGTMVAFAAPDPGPVVFGSIIFGSAAVAAFAAVISGRVLDQ